MSDLDADSREEERNSCFILRVRIVPSVFTLIGSRTLHELSPSLSLIGWVGASRSVCVGEAVSEVPPGKASPWSTLGDAPLG